MTTTDCERGLHDFRSGRCLFCRIHQFPAATTPPEPRPCPVPKCRAGMLRSVEGRDEVSCPVCDGTITAEEYRRAPAAAPEGTTKGGRDG